MATPSIETFTVEPHARSTALVRHVLPASGTPYHHTCPLEAFEVVALAVEDAGQNGFEVFGLAGELDLPFSQVATAIAFLRERGIVERCNRGHTKRSYPLTDAAHLDAMAEYHALREKPADPPPLA
ncbi:MAG TPA: hypothetical protein PKE29_16680 [Phycisphaerales bacterium]|nr:hypothetical protein [Phycisphaerales bacterium]